MYEQKSTTCNWVAANSDISFQEGFCAGISRFFRSFLALAAWQTQEGLYRDPQQLLRTTLTEQSSCARSDRPFLCLPQANPCVLAVSRALQQPLSSVRTTSLARANTVILLLLLLPSTNQYHCTSHSTQTSNATALSPAQIRDPARSALKRDIRALTSPPAWLAAVARSCSPFASTAT